MMVHGESLHSDVSDDRPQRLWPALRTPYQSFPQSGFPSDCPRFTIRELTIRQAHGSFSADGSMADLPVSTLICPRSCSFRQPYTLS
jgi:hypothetical protein